MKISMLMSVRDDGDLKAIIFRIAYGKTYPVYGNRAFFYSHVSFGSFSFVKWVLKSIIPTTVSFIYMMQFGLRVLVLYVRRGDRSLAYYVRYLLCLRLLKVQDYCVQEFLLLQ